MKLITLYLPETYIKALDQLVEEKFYPNRAEAIRVSIRDLISSELWQRKRTNKPISESTKSTPRHIEEVERNIQIQTFKADNYKEIANPFCPHCEKPLTRSKGVWRGRFTWKCPDHGRVLPACQQCDKNHHNELTSKVQI